MKIIVVAVAAVFALLWIATVAVAVMISQDALWQHQRGLSEIAQAISNAAYCQRHPEACP